MIECDPNKEKETPLIFLNYAREDADSVRVIANELSAFGLNLWVDYENIHPGDDWKLVVSDAIEKCDFFLAIMSSRSLSKRGYVQRELREALSILVGLREFIISTFLRISQSITKEKM